MKEFKTDILIAGGSFGGISAALAAAKAGCRVIVTEETSWIGGQATTQGVPLDEHPWIEKFGASSSYMSFRNKIRDYYRRNYRLTTPAQYDRYLNPGACWVSALGFEPRTGVAVLEEMLAPYRTNGLVQIWTNYRPCEVEIDGDLCRSVTFRSTITNAERVVSAPYILDATELGELLELGGIEHVTGAESRSQTGEPLAPEVADPLRQQPFTHLIALEYRPGEDHTIDKPSHYEEYHSCFKALKGISSTVNAKEAMGFSIPDGLFAESQPNRYTTSIWNFRRYFYHGNFDPDIFTSDITVLMNGNEYHDGVLCGVVEDEAKRHMKRAREQTLSLLYFLQTEAIPGYMGKPGFPGLNPRPDVFGSEDGLAQYPYIRESRRILAEYTVVEQDFRIDMNPDGPVRYKDSVGLAGYRIDIHEAARDGKQSITNAEHGHHWTQQIPLGALIPVRVENLLPCCKNLGVTHITNGSFRLHPVEWNIGEAAGALAAYCLRNGYTPRQVRNNGKLLNGFQAELSKRGVELEWPQMSFGRSYFSEKRNMSGWYFGEADKLPSTHSKPIDSDNS